MSECLNAVGFVFNSVKTYIKHDKYSKYINDCCQKCNLKKNNCKITGFLLNSCGNCNDNSQYKICIFRLKKENFVSSSLDISTGVEDAWENFKKNISEQKNGNFVISVTKKNKLHSFYANMIKSKKCKCCETIILYFKYNIISLFVNDNNNIYNNSANNNINSCDVISANIVSNITYNLKNCEYDTVRFFNSSEYTYTPIVI